MFLLDSGSGAQFGGTGKVFDWNQAYGANAFGWIVLAGGLNPDNVGEAVSRLHPFAVDVSSGVESSPGKRITKRCGASSKQSERRMSRY